MTIVRMKSIDYHGLEDQFGKLTPWGEGLTSNMEQVRIYGMLLFLFVLVCFSSFPDHPCHPCSLLLR